jgi:EAL domain-containing protein (putative c-di-GMP-specific phosphodiesterase class I)
MLTRPVATAAAPAALPYTVYNDGLSGLPGCARLRGALGAALAGGEPAALLYAMPHDTALVGDGLGLDAVSSLLDLMGRRLAGLLGPRDTLALTTDDSFVLIVRDIGPADRARVGAEEIAEHVLDALNAPFSVAGAELALDASVGVSVTPHDGVTIEHLCRGADLARHEARADGGGVALHHAGAPDPFERLLGAARLRRAIERDELELHWQGIHRVADRRVMGAEALVRWRHPERGLVMPGEFVPLAERTGIIESLGDWVMREVCRQAAEWQSRGLTPKLGMNISPRQLRRRGFAARLAAEVGRAGISPDRIVFELTESAWVRSSAGLMPVVEEVRAAGMMFALDDFGAGYSSLGRLAELPAHIIKVDRAFLRGVPDDPQATEILLGVLRVAAACGADVTVEGVETEEQLALLEAHGYRFLQGFLLSRPVPAEQFESALLSAIVPERRA